MHQLNRYDGASQADIHRDVCSLTDELLKLRNAKGYVEQSHLQRVRRQRAELQSLLRKPTLVWSAP